MKNRKFVKILVSIAIGIPCGMTAVFLGMSIPALADAITDEIMLR